ncbi:MAG: hypothetical protein LC657_12035 [Desulfobacteraceae bacterium]|nr:hypothetical protein [Desulfobacteraceae bacterium]
MNRKGRLISLIPAWLLLLPAPAFAIQLHTGNAGIIAHQIGHLFFLFAMVALMFTINSRGLIRQKGWRQIHYGALFFVFWNLDTLVAHFLDNQIEVVRIETLSILKMAVVTQSDSQLLAVIYYFLKMDHLWCVPAMIFLFMGLDNLLKAQQEAQRQGPGGKGSEQ